MHIRERPYFADYVDLEIRKMFNDELRSHEQLVHFVGRYKACSFGFGVVSRVALSLQVRQFASPEFLNACLLHQEKEYILYDIRMNGTKLELH